MERTTYYPKALPEDDGVISVTMERIPRWKESELSGDEWRYSLVTTVTFKDWANGGTKTETVSGRDFAQMAVRLAALLDSEQSCGVQKEKPYTVRDSADLEVCFQPGCADSPINVYAIKQEWTWHPYQGNRMEGHSLGPSVRAFCEAHSHRGDCDLEDQDDNYELLSTFLPREWAGTLGEDSP